MSFCSTQNQKEESKKPHKRDVQKLLTYILDEIPLGILVVDIKQEKVISYNKILTEMFNLKDKKDFKKFCKQVKELFSLAGVKPDKFSREEGIFEFDTGKGEKSLFLVNFKGFPYISNSFIFIFTDVSIFAMITHHLKEQLSQKGEILDISSRYLASILHEIKTPLSGINMMAYLLRKRREIKKDAREYVESIFNMSIYLSMLFEKLSRLLFSPYLLYDLKPEEFNPSIEIKEIIQMIKFLYTEKHSRIIIKALPEDLKIRADRTAFREIVSNLLTNAVKYSPEGSDIYIEYKLDNNYHSFTISNSVENPEIIEFKVRKKEEIKSPKKLNDSWGIGLYITRRLISLHNGKFDFKIDKNKKKVFVSFLLPV